MANEIAADDHELKDQQVGASEGPVDDFGEEMHDKSSAHQGTRTNADVDEGTDVNRDEGAPESRSENGAESAEQEPAYIEEELWKTERVEEYPEGFPQAAAVINADPTFAIYRRFSRGRARIILQLQAQLMMLEKKLDQYDKELAGNRNTETTLHQSEFPKVSVSEPALKELQEKWIQRYAEFEKVLKMYDDAIIRDFTLRRLPSPSLRARNNLGRYFYQERPLVEGENDHMTYVEDLIAVGRVEKDSWLEGSIYSCLESQPLRCLKRFFISPEQRHKTKNNKYGQSEFFDFVCSKRVKGVADIIMIFIAFMLSLLPFHIFFNVNLSIIIIAFISSLLSAFLLTNHTVVESPQLYIIAISQSSFLVLGALVAQVSNNLSLSALDDWFRFNMHLLVSGALDHNIIIFSIFYCLIVLLCFLNYF